MSGAQRRKGRVGENEARKVFEEAGFNLRSIQNNTRDAGDFVATIKGVRFVCESKRREKVRVLEWSRQVEAVALDGEVPLTIWRSSREPWRVTMLASDFVRLVSR